MGYNKKIHECVMKIDVVGHVLRMDASRLLPTQINNYGKDIQKLCNRIRELEKHTENTTKAK